MKSSRHTCNLFPNLILAFALALAAAQSSGQTIPCIETNGYKFLLPPQNFGGFDVRDSRNNIVLADDFFCNTPGPITDIHLWGSWNNEQHGTITNFWIGIYDDVPSVTNAAGGLVSWSHPGTNLLWQQNFRLGQFSESIYTNADEYFYDPPSDTIIGGDQTVWYYCFYPTNPFVQGGSANRPTNYWLAVRAQLQDTNLQILYGWKSTYVPYNDPAVWSTIGPGGLPFPNWRSITNPLTQQPMHLSMKLTTPLPECCPETNDIKWVQRPNLVNGVDVDFFSTHNGGIVLADDFKCTNSGAITDIHLWGSWTQDATNPAQFVTLGIWSDVPAGPASPYSHPGTLLWSQTFNPGEYTVCPVGSFPETVLGYLFFPGSLTVYGATTNLYYFCFFPTNPFVQTGSREVPTNYWLSVYAPPFLNWKTSIDFYNDTAVAGNWPGTSWIPINDPTNGQPLSFSFKLTTSTNTPTPCVETNGTKYVQWPDPFGLDVWDSGPWVLADDFICTNSGKITDIHLWGSWRGDQVLSNSLTFTLAIYDDVPVSPTNNFSHPGNLRWQQLFLPGQYFETFYGFGQETFLDPGPPAVIGGDQQIWYYCFYPTNPFVQTGSMTSTQTYWLVAYAQLPSGSPYMFGWKSTTNVQHDISVHAPWPGAMPPNPWPWNPTFRETGLPVDLAFKITTDTNQCPIPVVCAGDKIVECGFPWVFDPPLIGPDPCCPTNPTVTFGASTNSLDPCKQIVTGIWTIMDCLGTTVNCTQKVTIVDSTPPTITCASNKTVECGSPWTFDPPTAVDACCGTNVTITILNTLTNGNCPQLFTRTWQASDCCSNVSICSQLVTVRDITPPSINCPSNIVLLTCDTNATMVTWSIIATDLCSSVTVTSTPPSGTLFLPNTTNTVTAVARDDCGNTNTCSFTVAVRRPVLGPIFINQIATNMVVLTWTNGILQSSTNVIGPYLDVPSATSPYTNTSVIPPDARFYRLRCNQP